MVLLFQSLGEEPGIWWVSNTCLTLCIPVHVTIFLINILLWLVSILLKVAMYWWTAVIDTKIVRFQHLWLILNLVTNTFDCYWFSVVQLLCTVSDWLQLLSFQTPSMQLNLTGFLHGKRALPVHAGSVGPTHKCSREHKWYSYCLPREEKRRAKVRLCILRKF